jgi:hypothetical protein
MVSMIALTRVGEVRETGSKNQERLDTGSG